MKSFSLLAAVGSCLGLVVACGAFGADEPEPEPVPPPQPPATNAIPPSEGQPLVGVFVSASKGDDKNDGTQSRPFKTLAAAMKNAKLKSLRVIACAENYAENVELVDGISVYGAFDCSEEKWKASGKRATVHAPESPALVGKNLTLEMRIDGVEIYGPDRALDPPSESARSSIGIEIHDSVMVTFANSLVRSGTAGSGKGGNEGPVNFETGKPKGAAGSPKGGAAICPYIGGTACAGRSTYSGGSGGTSTCKIGNAGGAGGSGGDGAFWQGSICSDAQPSQAHGKPAAATTSTAAGSLDYCADYRAGGKLFYGAGAAGANALDGADGANGAWSLGATGFALGHGTAGTDGAAAQGGGGGGGTTTYENNCGGGICPQASALMNYNWTPTGGGGGAGGCAGFAGTPGFGGGASIAALIVKSTITLSNVTLQSGSGGNGGSGTLGSPGIAGGAGGPAASGGGAGGIGGMGGTSGLSGHGAPGPSIALAYSGVRPLTPDGTKIIPGTGGGRLGALTKPGNQGTKSLPTMNGDSIDEKMF